MELQDKRKVQKNYELGGGLYDLRYSDEQARKYDAAILLTLPRENDLILDNGCGTGMLLRRLDSQCVGLDLTPGLLKLAREKIKPNHHLVQGDSEHLPFRESVFQVVYAITLIQNTPNKEMTVSEMKRVTKPSGKMIVTALKVIFVKDFLRILLEKTGCKKFDMIGDAGTNDWIAYVEV